HGAPRSRLQPVLRSADGAASGGAVGRAVLQGPHHHDAGGHVAGGHQRHFGAAGGSASLPLHRGQPDHHRPEQPRRRRPRLRQTPPGRGGVLPPIRLYLNSDKDGSVLAKLERAVPQLAIQGHANAQFDPAKFTWLGSLSSYADDAYLMLINTQHAAKTVADL